MCVRACVRVCVCEQVLDDDWINPLIYRSAIPNDRNRSITIDCCCITVEQLNSKWLTWALCSSDPSKVLSKFKIPTELPVVSGGANWKGQRDLLNGADGVHPEKVTSRL